MIELTRFVWRGRAWVLAIGTDLQPRLLSSAPDQRTYVLVRDGEVGRAVPADEPTASADARAASQVDAYGWPAPADAPWLGWSFAIVLLGEDEARLRRYPPWR